MHTILIIVLQTVVKVMKTVKKWNFRPYTELHRHERGNLPYICRIAPQKGKFTVDFIDNGCDFTENSHLVFYRKRGEGEYIPLRPEMRGKIFTFSVDCEDECDYEVYVERGDGARSSVRLVRTGYVPGNVINYLHPEDDEYLFSGRYIASPSILKLPNGDILASMDVFYGNFPQNLTLIYRSRDGGRNFEYLTELFPCFWGKMFLSGGKLYMLGCSCEYGDLIIGSSDDFGENWTLPTVLLRGSSCTSECGNHRAPMRVEISHGLVMTDFQYGAWGKGVFCDCVISAPEGSDLLNAENWVVSEPWNPKEHPEAMINGVCGGIEGTVITAPDGRVYDILRYAPGKLLKLEFNPTDREGKLEFRGFIDCPITQSKVDIVYDEKTKLYFMIGSYKQDELRTNRNLLSLLCSPDLENWTLVKHLIDYSREDSSKIGFQYVSFEIDGEDIIYQSRTSFNNAHSFHDSNYMTFHRIENFRILQNL